MYPHAYVWRGEGKKGESELSMNDSMMASVEWALAGGHQQLKRPVAPNSNVNVQSC